MIRPSQLSEQVTAAAKSSATFNAPRISRCGEDARVLRGDAEPPAARAGRALWPNRCARRAQNAQRWPCKRCKGISRAGNVHTTGKVIAVSTFHQISTTDRTHARTGPDTQRAQAHTFQDSEFPQDSKKKKKNGAVSVQKHRGEPDTLYRSAAGGGLPRFGSTCILLSKKQFPSFRVSAAPPLRGWRERSKKQFPSFRSAPPQIGERSKKQFPSFRSAPSQVGERSKKQFPSFRSVPPQVGERSKKQFPSFRVSAAPPLRLARGIFQEGRSDHPGSTIQIPRLAPDFGS